MNRMIHNDDRRRQFVQGVPPVQGSAVMLGQAPTQKQVEEMQQAQIDRHCIGVSQAIFNQVVAHMLSTMDEKHQRLTHEKMLWLAEQCRAVAPYALVAFGAIQIKEQTLPSEPSENENES